MRALAVTAAAAVAFVASASLASGGAPPERPAYTSASDRQVRTLKRQLRETRESRATWRDRARSAELEIDALSERVAALDAALKGDLAGRVERVARDGRISELHRLVLEPVRTAWPCGSTLFQGQYSWSLGVDLEDRVRHRRARRAVLPRLTAASIT